MPDSLRELVVTLSLQSDNFTRNIKSINTEISDVESRFKLAGAGVENFDKTINGLSARLSTAREKLSLQKDAVDQYSQKLNAAKAHLTETVSQLTLYRARLEAAKANQEECNRRVAEAADRYNALRNSLGDSNKETKEAAKAYLDAQKDADSAAKSVEKLSGQCEALRKATLNAADGVSTADKQLNMAKAAVIETEKQVRTLSSAFTYVSVATASAAEYFDMLSKRTQQLGRLMTRYVTTPIIALGAASIKSSIDFESAFASVRKTTEATEEEFAMLQDVCLEMSEAVGTSASDIAEVMAIGGQLGIQVDKLEEFTRVMIDLGNSAEDLSASQGAETLARFANVMQDNDYASMGAAIVDLGNNTATTEKQIMEMAQRIAGAGKQVGLSSADVLGLAAAFSSLGLEAQAGGTAVSKALVRMEVAVKTSIDEDTQALKDFAMVSGVTTSEFKEMWERDAVGTFQTFINGLAKMDEEGQSAVATLQEIGFSEVRLRDAMLRITNGYKLLNDAVAMSNDAWSQSLQGNSALVVEANKRYATTAVQLANLKDKALNFARTVGDDLNPMIRNLIASAGDFVDKLKEMDPATRQHYERILAIVAAIGPALLAYSKLNKGLSSVMKTISTFTGMLGSKGLAATLANYPGLIAAITVAVGYGAYKLYDYASGAKQLRDTLEGLKKTASEWESTSANTFYGSSNGLQAFGISAEEFTKANDAQKWFNRLLTDWNDTYVESEETVQNYTDSFKALTETTRKGIDELSIAAAENGMTGAYDALRADINLLDQIDAEMAALLKDKREWALDDETQAKIKKLQEQRYEIEIKYGFADDTKNSFKKLDESIDAEIARATARGEKVSDAVYKDALVAAAEGMQIVNKEIDAEYDQRLKIINAITEETQRTEELTRLNEWYNNQRKAYGLAYADTMGKALSSVLESDSISDAYDEMQQLFNLINDYKPGDTNTLTAIQKFAENLSEDNLADLLGVMAQIESLSGQGLNQEEVASALGLTEEQVTKLNNALGQYKDIVAFLGNRDLDTNLSSLQKMFLGALPEEALKIATDLDMSKAVETWTAFAENPGSDVLTDAVVETYKEKDGGADKSLIDNPGGFYALVVGYNKDPEKFNSAFDAPSELTALVEAYAKDPDKFSDYFAEPNGLSALVEKYEKDPDGFASEFDGPSELLAYVAAYAKDPDKFNKEFYGPDGLLAYVTGYEKSPTFNSIFASPTGLKAYVEMYAKDQNFRPFFEGPVGLSALVKMYGKDPAGFDAAFESPSGLEAYVLKYAADPEFKDAFDGPSGLNALVAAYKADPENFNDFFGGPSGLVALVGAYEKDPNGFNAFFENPNGLTALVTAYEKDPDGFNAAFANPSGLLALVKAYKEDPETFVNDFPGPSGITAYVSAYSEISGGASKADLNPVVPAYVELADISETSIRNWHLRNDSKVKLETPVNLPVNAALGNDWKTEIQTQYEQGMIEVYGQNGAKLNVTPELLNTLDANDIVVGLGEDKKLHIQVVPNFEETTAEDVENLGKSLEKESNVWKWSQLSQDSMWGSLSQYVQFAQQTRDNLNNESPWVRRFAEGLIESKHYEDIIDSSEEAKLATWTSHAVAALKNGQTLSDEDAARFSEVAQALKLMAESGENSTFMSNLVSDLEAMGISIKESNLGSFLMGIVDDQENAEEYIEKYRKKGEELGSAIGEGVNSGMSSEDFSGGAEAMASSVEGAAKEALQVNSPSRRMMPVGLGIAEGLAAGITSGTSTVVSAITALANAAVAAAKEALDIHSPSRVFKEQVGEMAMAGFGEGILTGTMQQQMAIRNASRYIVQEAQNGASYALKNGATTYNYQTDARMSFEGANFNVRSETDIYALAQEIAALTKQYQRGRGDKG